MDQRLIELMEDRIKKTNRTAVRLAAALDDFLKHFPDLEKIDRTGYYPMVTSHVVKFIASSGHMGQIRMAFQDKGWTMTSDTDIMHAIMVFTLDRDNEPDPYQAIVTSRGYEGSAK